MFLKVKALHWECSTENHKLPSLPSGTTACSFTLYDTLERSPWPDTPSWLKTKAPRSRLNKEIINNERVLSSPLKSNGFPASSVWSVLGGEISVDQLICFPLLISRDTVVIPWVLLDMFHYGTISSYYGGKNQGCVCTLIQHLFKQMKSLWKLCEGNLFVPLWLSCHPKT